MTDEVIVVLYIGFCPYIAAAVQFAVKNGGDAMNAFYDFVVFLCFVKAKNIGKAFVASIKSKGQRERL